jgi:hypothetical protein
MIELLILATVISIIRTVSKQWRAHRASEHLARLRHQDQMKLRIHYVNDGFERDTAPNKDLRTGFRRRISRE